jgi:hypothetical protein
MILRKKSTMSVTSDIAKDNNWRNKMDIEIQKALGKLFIRPGQGSLLEQMDKLLREIQRSALDTLLKEVNPEETNQFIVDIYHSQPQVKMKEPTLVRFNLPEWKGFNEVFWHALGDYLILTVHSVIDVDFNRIKGTLKVRYFHTEDSKKSPEDIKNVIKKLAVLIEKRILPTDFTIFRRMAERNRSIGEISKKEAAIIGGVFELAKLIA